MKIAYFVIFSNRMVKQPIFNKLELLDAETEMLYRMADGLSEEDLHDHSYGWSIIQVFSHLNMAESGSVRYMKKKMQAGDEIPQISFLGKFRFLLTKGLLQSSLRWKAPKVVSQPKGDLSLKEMQETWAETRKATKQYVETYPEHLLNKAVYKHPFAGRMDLAGAIGSFIYHQRHHMHQIRRIRKKIGR